MIRLAKNKLFRENKRYSRSGQTSPKSNGSIGNSTSSKGRTLGSQSKLQNLMAHTLIS